MSIQVLNSSALCVCLYWNHCLDDFKSWFFCLEQGLLNFFPFPFFLLPLSPSSAPTLSVCSSSLPSSFCLSVVLEAEDSFILIFFYFLLERQFVGFFNRKIRTGKELGSCKLDNSNIRTAHCLLQKTEFEPFGHGCISLNNVSHKRSSILQITNGGSTLVKGIATDKMWGIMYRSAFKNGYKQFIFELLCL